MKYKFYPTIYITIAIFTFTLALAFGSYTSAYNYGNQMDNQIQAQYSQMENVLAQYSQRIQELAQVPSMYRDDLKEVISSTMQGRYGKDGNRAMFSFIKEHSQGFDASLYKTISQSIEAGRKDFEFENKKLIDLVAEYKTTLGTLYTGLWMRVAGYPKIDLNQFKPISNTYASDTFKEGKEVAPMKLR